MRREAEQRGFVFVDLLPALAGLKPEEVWAMRGATSSERAWSSEDGRSGVPGAGRLLGCEPSGDCPSGSRRIARAWRLTLPQRPGGAAGVGPLRQWMSRSRRTSWPPPISVLAVPNNLVRFTSSGLAAFDNALQRAVLLRVLRRCISPRIWRCRALPALPRHRRARIFYAWWRLEYVFLPFVLTLIAWVGVNVIERARDRESRRFRLATTLVLLFLPLAVFKYTIFVWRDVIGLVARVPPGSVGAWPLPLGVSFITFTLSAYVIDVYRRV